MTRESRGVHTSRTGRRKVHAAGAGTAGHACDTNAPYDDLDVTDDWGSVTCALCLDRVNDLRRALATVYPWDREADYSLGMSLEYSNVFVPDAMWDDYHRRYRLACYEHAKSVVAAFEAGKELPEPGGTRK